MNLMPWIFTISLTISTLHFTVPYGFGAATRYSINLVISNKYLKKTRDIKALSTDPQHLGFEWTWSREPRIGSRGSQGRNVYGNHRGSHGEWGSVSQQTHSGIWLQQWESSGEPCCYNGSFALHFTCDW